MNPYLESPTYWRGFHHAFITALESQLNETLPEGFSANQEERLVILPPGKPIAPDLYLSQEGNVSLVQKQEQIGRVERNTSTFHTEPFVAAFFDNSQESEPFIEITSANEEETVVAVIEVLSPTNKRNGVGRYDYLGKQSSLLRSRAHFLEIDLLIGGEHTVAVPKETVESVSSNWQYLASLHQPIWDDADMYFGGHRFLFWPIALHDVLPILSIPLSPPPNDTSVFVSLNLQRAFHRAFSDGPFRRRLKYQEPPPVPLQETALTWMDELLREKGLRLNITNEEVA